MKPENRKDFTYRPYLNNARQEKELWGVYVGKTILHRICHSEQEAIDWCEKLNLVPDYDDRVARQAVIDLRALRGAW